MEGPASILVADYCNRLMAVKMGARTSVESLTDFEMSYFSECYLAFEKLKSEELKKIREGNGKK